ncbi:14 kDa phosphohistidine phosphatase-like [Cataglyphis hispanica]|uniref:14 kDa phosphohistidine phosphatase-like n=1 Tax=Cataglyphis hispanica TaxID=1086592 RepID=UPI00217FCF8F|nr:14 kDa phosphohistidine phosphatase-like [Cataglyphis hispanica]
MNARLIILKEFNSVINIQRFITMSHLLDKVLDIDIDGHGRFKYILINVEDDVNKTSKQIVRGYARAQWHDNIQHGPKV